MAKLTAKQQRFVDAYDGNATEAALKAGYSAKTAYASGRENLRKPPIIEAIRKREETREKPIIATREARQRFWSDVMDSDEEDMKDRLRASELLGKSEGDFLERREITGKDGGPVCLVVDE